MKVDVLVDSLDTVDESDRAYFVETDEGKYRLDWAKRDEALKQPLISKNKDFQKRLEKVKPIADKFKDVAESDWSAFQDWKQAQQLDDDQDGDDETGTGGKRKPEDLHKRYREQLKSERAKLTSQKDAEVAEAKRDADEWAGKYRRERLSNRLMAMAADSDVFKEEIENYVDFLLYKKLFDLNEDGEIVFLEGDTPSAVAPDKAMAETLRERFPRFYQAKQQGGSGSKGGASEKSKTDWKSLSPAERMAFGRKNNKARA